MESLSFIEQQFPVARVSAESYKERMAGAGSSQTLTGVGKWWGRKPLVLVRACLLGLLMPVSNDPRRDREIFLKLMTMDEEGLWRRKQKTIDQETLESLLTESEKRRWLLDEQGELKARWSAGLSAEERALVQRIAFDRMSYDEKLDLCLRPEQIDGPSEQAWAEINQHLGTNVHSLPELVTELGTRRFGHVPLVGDPVCGGGSIPFEAARIGFRAYGSDLSPVASLLTWGAVNLVGGDAKTRQKAREIQQKAYEATLRDIDAHGLETNSKGWRHEQLYYVVEVKSPATGLWVPLAPSFVISEKYKVCALLRKNTANGNYDIDVITGASSAQMEKAKKGTLQSGRLVCPETRNTYAIADIRGDRRVGGEMLYGLRLWEKDDLVPRPDDLLQERLYCVRWKTPEGGRVYAAPDADDFKREAKALSLLNAHLAEWQAKGYLPAMQIPHGAETTRLYRERGWTYWHHLFTPRQLFMLGSYLLRASEGNQANPFALAVASLSIGSAVNRLSRLCGLDTHASKGPGSTQAVFTNQALNTQSTFGSRPLSGIRENLCADFTVAPVASPDVEVALRDARDVSVTADIWLTDPPTRSCSICWACSSSASSAMSRIAPGDARSIRTT